MPERPIHPDILECARLIPIPTPCVLEDGHVIKDPERFRQRLLLDLQKGGTMRRAAMTRLEKLL